MSDTAYVIWFVATALITTGIMLALIMEAMGTFSHGPKASRARSPRESKQYWPHTSALHHD